MPPADPVTLFVASCVMPAALTTYLFWSVYLFGTGATPSELLSRQREAPRRL